MKRKKQRPAREKTVSEVKPLEVRPGRRGGVLAVAVCLPGQPVRLAFDEREFLRLARK